MTAASAAAHQPRPAPTPGDRRPARVRHLQAAADLATRPPTPGQVAANPVTRLHLQDVADDLGRSRTSLYRLWPTQQAFWDDLTAHLAFERDYGRVDDATLPWFATVEAIEPAGTSDAELLEALRMGTALVEHLVLADVGIQLRATLLGAPDLDLVAGIRRRAEQRRLHDLGALVAGVLAVVDRRVAPPLTEDGLAGALWSLGDGYAILGRLVPSVRADVVVDDGLGPRPWTLLGWALRAILAECVVVGAAERADLAAAVPSLGQQYADLAGRWTDAQRQVLQAASERFIDLTAVGMHQEVAEDAEVGALGHVTVASVAREAGVTPRALYKLWPTVSELRLDLLRGFLGAERARWRRCLERVRPGPRAADEVVASLLRPSGDDRLPASQAGLAFLPDANHPAVRRIFVAELERTLASVAEHVDRLWPERARPSAAQLPSEQLAVLLFCLIAGANRLLRTEPDAIDLRAVRRHPDGAAVVQVLHALLQHGTGPVRGPRPQLAG